MDIPPRVRKELELIAEYVTDSTSRWMDVKVILLRSLPSSLRKNFSTRDPITKKQSLNNFERSLIDIYEGMTGIRLRLDNEQDR